MIPAGWDADAWDVDAWADDTWGEGVPDTGDTAVGILKVTATATRRPGIAGATAKTPGMTAEGADMIYLETLAQERGTYVIDIGPFQDESGADVMPNSITWTLTDTQGTVVNDREAVEVSTPGTSISIVLSGLDLAVGGGLFGTARKLLIEAAYDSDLGSDLPLKEEIEFNIQDFTALTGIT